MPGPISGEIIVTNSAGANVVPKSNGTNLVASSISDNGTTVSISNSINISAGKLLSVSSGSNQRAGNATLVAGAVTVSNTSVTANTVVILTRKISSGTIGMAPTYTVSAGVSFTITSDNALDTSTFSYFLIEVP